MNLIRNLNYFYQRKIESGFKIDRKLLVVDIGSGDKPFWRADVYVDDLSLGDIQRASKTKTIHDLGIFVDSNVIKLPFKNKKFDFSFCSHLLEHVEDPEKAIKEIVRISKSGYIEIPNGIIESVQPFVSHIWFVYRNKKKLVFVRKSKRMHEILLENENKFIKDINKSNDPFIRFYWNNRIDYEIVDEYSESDKYYSPKKIILKNNNKNYYLLLVKAIRMMFYKNKNIQI